VIDLLAHAAPISYRFPLPIWVYVVGGGAAVLLSAPAAMLAVRRGTPRRRAREVPAGLLGRPVRVTAMALCTLLLLWGFAGAFGFGLWGEDAHEFFENPMTVLTWVDFWVGLGLLATFVGDVWSLVSPLNGLARALDRALARRGAATRGYPAEVGRWPAVALLVLWSWCELVWVPAKNPPVLGGIMLGYIAVTLAGSAVYGAETWLDRVEVFTVVSRTFSLLAPLELRPEPAEQWLATEPEERRLALRPFGDKLRGPVELPSGGGVFVLAMLATVVFDGFSQTQRFTTVVGWIIDVLPGLGQHAAARNTLLLLLTVVLFVCAYLLVCLTLGEGDAATAAHTYAPTLIPIAAVYFVAHYFTYLLIAGQQTLGVLVDPVARDWNPWGLGEYPFHKAFLLAAAVWWTQVALIVWGHVEGVFSAHRVSLREGRSGRRALAAQAPLVALMVCYTMAGLWVLAQQLGAAG
jgi:hypothetical protein